MITLNMQLIQIVLGFIGKLFHASMDYLWHSRHVVHVYLSSKHQRKIETRNSTTTEFKDFIVKHEVYNPSTRINKKLIRLRDISTHANIIYQTLLDESVKIQRDVKR